MPDDPRTADEASKDPVQQGRYKRKRKLFKSFKEWWEAKGKNWYPNKWGSKGNPADHVPTVDRLYKMAQDEFPNDIIHREKTINGKRTLGGRKISGLKRNPDVWVEDANQPGVVKKVYEAARKDEGGDFVSREMDKKKQYDGLGVKSHFEEVRPDDVPPEKAGMPPEIDPDVEPDGD